MTKIDIISGFLGAGKTTLIKKLVADSYKGEKLVLIENEFGEIGIDGGFMKDAGIEITEMNSGCICCSLVGDFTRSLNQVLEQFAPDRIIIEPSGVGKLSDVINAVNNTDNPELQLNSATTVVNVEKCRMYMRNFGEFFNNQVEFAGAIVLSRTDKADAAKISTCVEMLREHNSSAVIITTPIDELSGEQLAEALSGKNSLNSALEDLLHEHEHHHEHEHEHDENCTCGCHDHDHHHEHEHEHDENCTCGCHDHDHHHEHEHHHADEVFASWGRETTRRYTAAELEQALKALSAGTTYGVVLRAKGIVAGENGWLHFDYVPGEANVRSGSADIIGRLCVIGAALNETALAELFGVN